MNLQTASYQELAAERREKNTNNNFLKLECVGSTINTGVKSRTHFKLPRSHSIQTGIIIDVHNDDPESLKQLNYS